MELNTESILMQSNITGPAFLVKDGIITDANTAAQQRRFSVGAAVEPLIQAGADMYRSYKTGKLYLQLSAGEYCYGAYVTKVQDMHLFCLESDYANESLRILALISQQLRQPLSNAMLSTELLQQNSALQEDPGARAKLGHLNRALHQLTRAVCNMSDAANPSTMFSRQETRDASAVLNELLVQLEAFVTESGRVLSFTKLRPGVQCLIDEALIKRALLNLLSNAIQFSPKDSTIKVKLQHKDDILRITVENPSSTENSPIMSNAFQRFLREPGIEDSRYGIGLGMTLVRQVAVAHGGTVLFDSNKKNAVKVIMTVSTNRKEPPVLRSSIQLVGNYNGGLDTLLIELSDVLPDSLYEGF